MFDGMLMKRFCEEQPVTFKIFSELSHCVKNVRIRSFSRSYFPTFVLNTERYEVYLRIQSKCWKKQIRKTSSTDTFHTVLNLRTPWAVQFCFFNTDDLKVLYIYIQTVFLRTSQCSFLLFLKNTFCSCFCFQGKLWRKTKRNISAVSGLCYS